MSESFSIVLLLGLFAGGGSVDLVSSLPAKNYLKAREIEVSADKLMELASKKPATAKESIAQLFALSHLAAEPDLIKKSAKAAEYTILLKDISTGAKAADPSGFAAAYADRALRAVKGMKDPPQANRRWSDAIAFLPEDATMVGLIDLAAGGGTPRPIDVGSVLSAMPPDIADRLWEAIEKIGNVRIDGFGFGLTDGPGQPMEMVFRVTGKANPEWLLSVMTDLNEVRTNAPARVLPDGRKVREFTGRGDGPSVMIVGDSEILIGGHPPEFNRDGQKRIHADVLNRLLDVRGKSKGPLNGVLKADLAKVPADATGLLVGALSEKISKGAPFPMPEKVLVYAKRAQGGVDLVAQGTMKNAKDAEGLIEIMGKGRDAGLQALKQVQGQPIPGLPANLNLNSIVTMLESVQLQSNGMEAQARVLVPDDALGMLPSAFLLPLGMRAGPPPNLPPQNAPAKDVKKE